MSDQTPQRFSLRSEAGPCPCFPSPNPTSIRADINPDAARGRLLPGKPPARDLCAAQCAVRFSPAGLAGPGSSGYAASSSLRSCGRGWTSQTPTRRPQASLTPTAAAALLFLWAGGQRKQAFNAKGRHPLDSRSIFSIAERLSPATRLRSTPVPLPRSVLNRRTAFSLAPGPPAGQATSSATPSNSALDNTLGLTRFDGHLGGAVRMARCATRAGGARFDGHLGGAVRMGVLV
jgi:hypothetical protein